MEKLELGTRLNGRYLIKRFIGEGNMSYVYEVFDDLLQRMTAIKQMIIPAGSWDIDLIIKRFKREYLFLSSIEHPNVVKAYGFFVEKGHAFMVLELINGVPLQEMIEKRKNHISMSVNLTIATQLTRAIEVINTAGIIHRDIKPTNIIVNGTTKRLKLLDLGVATSVKTELSRLTNHGEVVGTPDYLSPEQVGGTVALNSDVFSVAVVLYQLFCGEEKSPFHSESSVSTMMAITTKPLPPLMEKISPSSPLYQRTYQKISDLLEESLCINPEKRLDNAGKMAKSFDQIFKYYRAEKSQLKERKTVILQNWVFSEEVEPNAEQIKNLKKLGDQFGRDDISYKKSTSKKTTSMIKRNKRYTGTTRKNSTVPILEWLIIAVVLLIIVLFIAIDFSSKPKIITQKEIDNLAMEKLREIKLLSVLERWHSLNNFISQNEKASSFIQNEASELKKQDEISIEKKIEVTINAIETKKVENMLDIYNVVNWSKQLFFQDLLEKNDIIKRKFLDFLGLVQNKKYKAFILNRLVKDFYKHRNYEYTKDFLSVISQHMDEDSDKDIKKIYHLLENYSEIFSVFLDTLKKNKDHDKPFVFGILRTENPVTTKIKDVGHHNIILEKVGPLKVFNIGHNVDIKNMVKAETIDFYYPSNKKTDAYVNYMTHLAHGENDLALMTRLVASSLKKRIYDNLDMLLETYKEQSKDPVDLKIYYAKNRFLKKTNNLTHSKIKLKAKITGELAPHITKIRMNSQYIPVKKGIFTVNLTLKKGKNIFLFGPMIQSKILMKKKFIIYYKESPK